MKGVYAVKGQFLCLGGKDKAVVYRSAEEKHSTIFVLKGLCLKTGMKVWWK